MITIEVKKKHIKLGKTGMAKACPVFLAMQAAGVNVKLVMCDDFKMVGESRYRPFPKKVEKFITAFDAGKKVKPFSFRVTV